ncbi:MAG: double-strand break repair helicase AddA, partial [Pseudomonadota bacterium]
VARLLLEQVDPQNILCLTYTKAAAAEMQNRLFQRLGAWAMMPDDALRRDLETLGFERTITTGELARARTLFAQAIETPGGLKIQTIHAFSAGVLRRFPLEAGVSPQFREMEDRQVELLRQDVVDELLTGPQAGTVRDLLAVFTSNDLASLTAECANKRSLFVGSPDLSAINRALGLPADAGPEEALKVAFDGGEKDLANNIADAFAGQSAMYQTFARRLTALPLDTPDLETLETLFGLFLYAKDGTSKSVNFPQANHTKAVEALTHIADDVHAWMDRVANARQTLLSVHAARRAKALATFGAVFVPAYEARKTALGLLDFDDLIQKTRALLTDRRVAQWVLFRLDGGIDHVLVDEAQDTSPDQWAVIKQLTQEFTAGEGADPSRQRTIFVVGDKKQSIYSFQGADPGAFDEMRTHFETGLAAVGDSLHPGSLLHSFRSSQAILRVVDATFQRDRAAGLEPNVQHLSFKANMPGRVDLWPVVEPTNTEKEMDWTAPVDTITPDHHHVRLANQVAADIRRMIQTETIPDEIGHSGTYQRRRITEGDILILVQRRSELFSEIIRACKAAGLEVAGADRLRVGAELAVKDITALLSFLALPEDDLSLAAALKSPLFCWTEQDLYTLAHHRPTKGYVWSALRDHDGHATTREILTDLRQSAEFLRPYDLIARILIRHGGREKLIARLGEEVEDGIDALLSQALAYESTGVPSLTGFLAWMATDALEVKRQMESQGDKIRVMTVHGAKGLEAPIVILPETAKRPNLVRQEILTAGQLPVWKPKANATPEIVADLLDGIRAKQAEERMRLLYVAMTRAEKWLIVAAAGDVGEGDDSWYTCVSDGMTHAGDTEVAIGGNTIRRVTHLGWDEGEPVSPDVSVKEDRPALVLGDLPNLISTATLSPSDLGGAKALPGDFDEGDRDTAMARGTALHLLLEHLPAVDPTHRHDVGMRILADHAEEDQVALIDQALSLLENPTLSHLFVPSALTEVDVTASLPALNGQRIHGAIDRLLVDETTVVAVDYKSNRVVPKTPDATPDGLLRQMGAYHAALTQIFPDHTISTAILWTNTATLMPLPAALTASALAKVTDA